MAHADNSRPGVDARKAAVAACQLNVRTTVASVEDAPLTEVVVGDESRWWFDTSGVPELSDIDVLFVDGPVGGTSHRARYPAFPVFADRLAPGALVVLDDMTVRTNARFSGSGRARSIRVAG